MVSEILRIPKAFQQPSRLIYPPDNNEMFEQWFTTRQFSTDRIYLGIWWTAYYVNNQFGKNETAIKNLQDFIDSLDKTKKYYTIVQYDDGILNDISQLDIDVFSMSGHGITLPLVSKPHRYKFDTGKKYLANFIGKNTHPIRQNLFELSKVLDKEFYYISEKNHTLEGYCKIISESMFTLCPRGYGKSSFRIQEAIQYNSIPVYISDDYVLPERFNNYGLCISDINKINETLSQYTYGELFFMREKLKKVYEEYYTYEAVKRYIINYLSHEKKEKEKNPVLPEKTWL